MANILDYLTWRGDISFKSNAFNEIDSLILCQITYLNFDGLLSDELKSGMTLEKLWQVFKSSSDFEVRSDLGMLINKDTVKVFEAAANSTRFKNIKACVYVNRIDKEKEEQFAAVTYLLDKKNKNPFVVFRGTDDTIVGWKEDFNMALSTSVPSQIDSLEYVNKIAKKIKGKISIAGHSKGGNLAVYAGSFLNSTYKKRIEKIYNFDGPGFTSRITSSIEYKTGLEKITSWYPHKSIVGMFFEHNGKQVVVESCVDGLFQHDPMTWQITRNYFVTKPSLDSISIYFNKIINTWIKQLSQEKLVKIIDTVFAILGSTGATTNSEIEANLLGNSKKMLRQLRNVDDEVKDEVGELFKIIFNMAIDKLKS